MKLTRNIAVLVATLAFGAAPAVAIASGGGNSKNAPGHNKTTSSTSSTSSTPSTPSTSKAKAYGKACQGESKAHVAGQKGTPFSECVVAMAQLAKSSKTSASAACKSESKKHVQGSKGTPFSECVVAAAKLRSSKS